MLDLLIIGAGPAGANLARLIGNDKKGIYKTAIIDKRALDASSAQRKIKSCGGLLSPDAQAMLAELGLSLPASIMDSPQFFKVRTIDFDNQIERDYKRLYYNIDREQFDRFLYHLIPDSIEKITDAVVNSIINKEDHWEVSYYINNTHFTISTRCIIAADGANSFTRRKICEPSHKANYFSIQSHFKSTQSLPYFVGIFDSGITDYYSWLIQKKDSIILGTALPLTEKHPHLKFELLKQKINAYLGMNLDSETTVEGAFIERTLSPKLLRFKHFSKTVNGKNLPLALIGEAAGATSPTSAEGISYALKTSLLFYRALQSSDFSNYREILSKYDRSCATIRHNIALKMLKSPGMYHKTVRGLVMQSGITAIKTEKGLFHKRKVLFKA